MSIGDSFRHVGALLDALECDDFAVAEVTPEARSVVGDGEVAIGVSVDVPLFDEADVDRVEVRASGVEVHGSCARLDLSFVLTVDESPPLDITSTDEGQVSMLESGFEVPPHRDPTQLRRVYESCESFTEMRDELGVDVTSEAVRQQMIKHGIHEAETQKPTDILNRVQAAEERTEDLDIVADGGALPGELTLEQLVDAVESSQTFYQAQQQLDIGQDEARRLLTKLNLIDCVTGRISSAAERSLSSEEIKSRIRDSLSRLE